MGCWEEESSDGIIGRRQQQRQKLAAQRMAVFLRKGEGRLFYAATMIPGDEEDRQRIRRHLEAREGWGFHTLETPFGL